MNKKENKAGDAGNLRPLTVDDLDRVIEIDSALSGNWRQGFYNKRLAAALATPGAFIHVGIDVNGRLEGFAFAQILRGEFGGDEAAAVLDAIGVAPEHGHRGLGSELLNGILDVMRRKNIRELRSQVDWRNTTLLGFLADAGFEIAPRLILERGTDEFRTSQSELVAGVE